MISKSCILISWYNFYEFMNNTVAVRGSFPVLERNFPFPEKTKPFFYVINKILLDPRPGSYIKSLLKQFWN